MGFLMLFSLGHIRNSTRIIVTSLLVLVSSAAVGQEPNLIILGWDGSDSKAIERQLTLGNLPNLARLVDSGGYWPLKIDRSRKFGLDEDAEEESNTSTKPGWAEVLTGIDPVLYGIRTNKLYKTIPDGETVYEKIRAEDPNLIVGWITGKPGNTSINCPNPESMLNNLCDDVKRGEHKYFKQPPNDWVANHTLNFLANYGQERFALFVNFAFPDWAGHYCPDVEWGKTNFRHGYMNSMIATPENGRHTACANYKTGEWIKWGGGTDYWTGQIMDALSAYGILDNTIIVLTSDHGFSYMGEGNSRGHADAPDSWAASNFDLALTSDSADLGDIAPTILALIRQLEE